MSTTGSVPRIRIEIATRTDVGHRREGNEDRALVATTSGEAHEGAWAGSAAVDARGVLLAVCDGMGGAAGGEIASSETIEVLRARLARPLGTRRDVGAVGQRLVDALRVAARTVRDHSIREPALSGMGTTATVAALVDERLVVAQVGDSRAYLLREGALTQLTRDQTLARLLVERGQLTEAEARRFEASNVILQAVGTSLELDVDLRSVGLVDGDVLLICSDGLCGPVEDEEIAAILAREPNPTLACEQLVRAALDAGGPDNVTCIVARVFVVGDVATHPVGPPRPEHVIFEPAEETPDTEPAPATASTGEAETTPESSRFSIGRAHAASIIACVLVTAAVCVAVCAAVFAPRDTPAPNGETTPHRPLDRDG